MPSTQRPQIVVIGSGISGLSAAWHLRHAARVRVLEASSRIGGHTHTREVVVDGIRGPVDTGFIVFNHRTYPEFRPWLAELGVPTTRTDMSFSVTARGGALEWSGSNLRTVFAQKRNLLSPRFWGMLRDILRFHKEAPPDRARLEAAGDITTSLGDYLLEHRYGEAFLRDYLLPMAGAIWSCPANQMRAFPFTSFVRFCENHGLLQVNDRPPWYTLTQGSSSYIRALQERLAAEGAEVTIEASKPVMAVHPRRDAGPLIVDVGGNAPERIEADAVVLACHAPEARALFARTDSPCEPMLQLLDGVQTQPNTAYLHTDLALMPRRRLAWAAWNYRSDRGDDAPVSVTYWMNRLQPLAFRRPVLVSLNPATPPREDLTLETVSYAHPIFDAQATAAQLALPKVQGQGGVYVAGAWTGYGFHEDGFRSGRVAAEAWLARP